MRLIVSLFALVLFAAPANAEKFRAATTFTIIADMARNVAGDAAEVVSSASSIICSAEEEDCRVSSALWMLLSSGDCGSPGRENFVVVVDDGDGMFLVGWKAEHPSDTTTIHRSRNGAASLDTDFLGLIMIFL